MSEAQSNIDQETTRRFAAHKELAKQAITDEMMVAETEDWIRSNKFSQITGRDPAGRNETWQENRKRLHNAQDERERRQDELDLTRITMDAQIQQSAQWADRNLDVLIDSAKAHEAQDAHINVAKSEEK